MLPARPLSGLVVLVPEAEPVVGQLRARLDPNAVLGVGAHVTVLYPFIPPDQVDAALLSRLRELFAAVPSFGYAFARTAWFGEDVLWLAPQDDRPFRELTELTAAAFPDYPPFDGAYADTIPHLTVGHEAGVDLLRAAEAELVGLAPIVGRATGVALLTSPDPDGPVTVREVFPLA